MTRLHTPVAWCSWCLREIQHELVREAWLGRNEYRCTACHQRTHRCRWCASMARGQPAYLPAHWLSLSNVWGNELCAEHAGEIASFERAGLRLADLADYGALLSRERVDVRWLSKVALAVAGGALVFLPAAYASVPRIAAAFGRLGLLGAAGTGTAIETLSGAALTSASLAALGNAGTFLLAAAGTALGAAEGARFVNAYAGQIRDFSIRRVHEGDGDAPAVLFINGFLSQDLDTCEDWACGAAADFAAHPWYHVRWESRRLRDLGRHARLAGGHVALDRFARAVVARATQGSSNPLGWLSVVSSLLRNPWHTALVRAGMTGALLADLLARTERPRSFVLMGHSLGARVIYYTLRTLSTTEPPIVRDVYLLGGAVGRRYEDGWQEASRAVAGRIYNCYSSQDAVLRLLYRVGTGGLSEPIGLLPIGSPSTNVCDVDVSDLVPGHLEYKTNLSRILDRIQETCDGS
jgi:hypothetical protein